MAALRIRVKKEVWLKVEQIIAIGEGWVKMDLSTDFELRMLKDRIFDLSAAQVDWLLTEMRAIDKGIQVKNSGIRQMGGS